MENAQPVADAIALLERLDVDEDGAFYIREDEWMNMDEWLIKELPKLVPDDEEDIGEEEWGFL